MQTGGHHSGCGRGVVVCAGFCMGFVVWAVINMTDKNNLNITTMEMDGKG